MSDLLPHLRAVLRRHGVLRADALLLIAVSGGPDSLCLLHLGWRLQADGGPRIHAAHFDHGLRPESSAEAAYVAELAAAWGLPISVERGRLSRLRGDNVMAAARRARYAFLAATARAIGATAVAVAHQADDQAETVLLHLLRGAGPAGLRGMRESVPWGEWTTDTDAEPSPSETPPVGPPLLRPLLTITRQTIEQYCRDWKLVPVTDPSNLNDRYTRVRIRRLLAALKAENPQIVEALGRTAAICADDYDLVQRRLDAVWTVLVREAPGVVIMHRDVWEAQHPALQRYALRRAAARLGFTEASHAQIEAARALTAHPGRWMRLGPTVRLEVEQDRLILIAREATPPADAPQLATETLSLTVPGVAELGGGWICVAQTSPPPTPSRWWVALDPMTLDGPLMLRRRRPGDRFRPHGAPGSRSLQDYFVDHKVPRSLRAAWPILATPAAVVWVPGYQADGRFVATTPNRGTIWIGVIRAPTEAAQPTAEGGMDRDIARVLISAEELRARVAELGAQITADYAGIGDLLLVGVLKGCAMFMVDLARSIKLPVALDFIAVASYGATTASSGVVRLLKDLDTDIAGRHVLLVEDIIDSGLTLAYLRSQLLRRNPASLRICTLLNKPERRTADVPVDYLGFNIPNEFVVGYGLDYAERYRNLPYIGILKPEIYCGQTP